MAEVIHLPKGAKPPYERETVVIKVVSRGGGSFSHYGRYRQTRITCHKHEVNGVVGKFSESPLLKTIYVIGYHESDDRISP